MINNCYPRGSTGKIVQSLEHRYDELGFDTVILYGHGEKSTQNHIKISGNIYMKFQALRNRITGIMYGGCYLSTRKAINIIRKEKPDIVHLHCLNSNFINIFRLVTWLKNNNVHTVLTNHAEFIYTANCGYAVECTKYQSGCVGCPRPKIVTKAWFRDGTHRSWVKMKKAFSGFRSLIVTNVSSWTTERASSSAILKEFEHYTVLNGVDASTFYYRGNYSKSENRMILHVTAKFSDDPYDLKGGRYLIELAKRFEGQNVQFVVAGRHQENIDVPSNVILLGNLSDQDELAELYSRADAVVLTSKRETFSMITAESLCCGTPVVGFRAGAPERITIPQFSEFVEQGDVDALYDSVKKILETGFNKEEISSVALQKYSNEKMADDYLKVYEKCLHT